MPKFMNNFFKKIAPFISSKIRFFSVILTKGAGSKNKYR